MSELIYKPWYYCFNYDELLTGKKKFKDQQISISPKPYGQGYTGKFKYNNTKLNFDFAINNNILQSFQYYAEFKTPSISKDTYVCLFMAIIKYLQLKKVLYVNPNVVPHQCTRIQELDIKKLYNLVKSSYRKDPLSNECSDNIKNYFLYMRKSPVTIDELMESLEKLRNNDLGCYCYIYCYLLIGDRNNALKYYKLFKRKYPDYQSNLMDKLANQFFNNVNIESDEEKVEEKPFSVDDLYSLINNNASLEEITINKCKFDDDTWTQFLESIVHKDIKYKVINALYKEYGRLDLIMERILYFNDYMALEEYCMDLNRLYPDIIVNVYVAMLIEKSNNLQTDYDCFWLVKALYVLCKLGNKSKGLLACNALVDQIRKQQKDNAILIRYMDSFGFIEHKIKLNQKNMPKYLSYASYQESE